MARSYELDEVFYRGIWRGRGALSEAAKLATMLRSEYIEEKLGLKLDAIRQHYVDISRERRERQDARH